MRDDGTENGLKVEGRADDLADGPQRSLLLEGFRQLPCPGLYLLLESRIGLLQLLRRAIELLAECLELVPGLHVDAMIEGAGSDPRGSFSQRADRRDHPASEENAGQDRQ